MKKMKKTKKMNEQDEEGEKEEEKMRKKSQSANSIPVPGSPAKAPLYNREGGREGRGGRVGGWVGRGNVGEATKPTRHFPPPISPMGCRHDY